MKLHRGSIDAIECVPKLVEAPSRFASSCIEAIEGLLRLASRFASRFEEKRFVRPLLSRFARLIEALIEGIEVREKKVCQAQSASSNELDNVVNLAERDCIFADVKYRHTHDEQEVQKTVIFRYVKRSENIADVFTKALAAPTHLRLCQMLGIK
jgi:hypothetical protein